MKKVLTNSAKSLLSSVGVFAARNYPNVVNGHDLETDLTVLINKPNPVCFDIGANRGQTIEVLKGCFPQPTIHAFEPSSATYRALAGQSFGSAVHLHQFAMGEAVGTAEFRNYKQSELSSFLPMNADTSENIFAREEMVSTETVQVETLDHFCTTHAIDSIDLLKIDTQGFELPVLTGGTNLFTQRTIGAVLLELNFSSLYDGQSDPLAIMHLLRSHNMRLVDFYEKERINGRELSWTTALFVRYP